MKSISQTAFVAEKVSHIKSWQKWKDSIDSFKLVLLIWKQLFRLILFLCETAFPDNPSSKQIAAKKKHKIIVNFFFESEFQKWTALDRRSQPNHPASRVRLEEHDCHRLLPHQGEGLRLLDGRDGRQGDNFNNLGILYRECHGL